MGGEHESQHHHHQNETHLGARQHHLPRHKHKEDNLRDLHAIDESWKQLGLILHGTTNKDTTTRTEAYGQ